MKKILLLILVALLSIAACKKEDNTEEDNIRFCPNIYAQYSYENNGDTAYCYVPNAFTVNGDGNNDLFGVYTYNVDSVYVAIKDGNTIVYQTDVWAEWDGRVNGQITYKVFDYIVSGKDIYGNVFNLTDTLSIIASAGDINYQWMNGTVNIASCRFGAQWDAMRYNPHLPTNEFFVNFFEEY